MSGPPLPPPDPRESPFDEPSGLEVSAPTTVFVRGTPSPAAEKLADAIVTARPGTLIVLRLD
jgi:hypothetical protein